MIGGWLINLWVWLGGGRLRSAAGWWVDDKLGKVGANGLWVS